MSSPGSGRCDSLRRFPRIFGGSAGLVGLSPCQSQPCVTPAATRVRKRWERGARWPRFPSSSVWMFLNLSRTFCQARSLEAPAALPVPVRQPPLPEASPSPGSLCRAPAWRSASRKGAGTWGTAQLEPGSLGELLAPPGICPHTYLPPRLL